MIHCRVFETAGDRTESLNVPSVPDDILLFVMWDDVAF